MQSRTQPIRVMLIDCRPLVLMGLHDLINARKPRMEVCGQASTYAHALDRADQRLAALLVDLGARSGIQERGGVRLPMRLTRQDIANMVGATTETVIRIMSRFKRDKLVSGTANRLIILDVDRLRMLASR